MEVGTDTKTSVESLFVLVSWCPLWRKVDEVDDEKCEYWYMGCRCRAEDPVEPWRAGVEVPLQSEA
jgi:hypothetical protein